MLVTFIIKSRLYSKPKEQFLDFSYGQQEIYDIVGDIGYRKYMSCELKQNMKYELLC